jgi:hypothetical protein
MGTDFSGERTASMYILAFKIEAVYSLKRWYIPTKPHGVKSHNTFTRYEHILSIGWTVLVAARDVC